VRLLLALTLALPAASLAQGRDSLPVDTLPPLTVSATRAVRPLTRTPNAVETVTRAELGPARPTLGLDEVLGSVPGVFVADRWNFSLDQRIAIRGFGARSAFAVRGVKVLLDGIPQTLPDGQGQLTNVELGVADRIEVLRGSSSALFGNAAGGVISIWTDPDVPPRWSEDARVVAGTFDRSGRTWSKWLSATRGRIGAGSAQLTVSRMRFDGERDHSAADTRDLNARLALPLAPGWELTAIADYGDDPRADNPGALTLAELQVNRDSAAAVNLQRDAGKNVSQGQGGVTVRRSFADGSEAAFTLFGFTRDLDNPQTFAAIRLRRLAGGARATVMMPFRVGPGPQELTAGVDVQGQRDDRVNFNYVGATAQPDTSRALDQLEHVTEFGPFVQSAVRLTPASTVTAGLRWDAVRFDVADRLVDTALAASNQIYLDDSGRRRMHALSGSFGFTLNPTDALTLYANAGSSFETPTTTELANRPGGPGGFNPALGPQTAWTYELGARGVSGGWVRWSAAVYQANVRGELIPFEEDSSPQRRFFRNAGSAHHRGIELDADALIAAGLRLGATYTYSDFRYASYSFTTNSVTHVLDGRPLPGVPAQVLDLRLAIRPRSTGGIWGEIETRVNSSVRMDDTLSTQANGWWTTDVRGGWEGRVAGLRLGPFAAVQNLFDRGYVGSVTINAARGRYYEPAPRRNGYFGLSFGW
jgi:iron complex outermembrane receptor protein